MPINSRRNLHAHAHMHSISRGLSRGLRVFRLLLRPTATVTAIQDIWSQLSETAYWRRKKRVYLILDLIWDLSSSSSSNPSQLRPVQELQSFIPTKEGNRKLQSYKNFRAIATRASELQRYPGTNTLKNTQKH